MKGYIALHTGRTEAVFVAIDGRNPEWMRLEPGVNRGKLTMPCYQVKSRQLTRLWGAVDLAVLSAIASPKE